MGASNKWYFYLWYVTGVTGSWVFRSDKCWPVSEQIQKSATSGFFFFLSLIKMIMCVMCGWFGRLWRGDGGFAVTWCRAMRWVILKQRCPRGASITTGLMYLTSAMSCHWMKGRSSVLQEDYLEDYCHIGLNWATQQGGERGDEVSMSIYRLCERWWEFFKLVTKSILFGEAFFPEMAKILSSCWDFGSFVELKLGLPEHIKLSWITRFWNFDVWITWFWNFDVCPSVIIIISQSYHRVWNTQSSLVPGISLFSTV